MLRAAADGRFPPTDGRVDVIGAPAGRSDAVVAFSAHNIVAADVDADEVEARLPSVDPGAPMSAAFLVWLGARLGSEPGMVDLVMGAFRGRDVPFAVIERDDLDSHPRVLRSRRYRTGVRVYTDPEGRGVVTIGAGLAGRFEVSVDVDPMARGRGLGTALAIAATALVPHGEPLFAQVSPGNVASVRAFLAAGYRPVCSEVLFPRTGSSRDPGRYTS